VPSSPDSAENPTGPAESGPSGDTFERVCAYAVVVGYSGLFAGIGLVFFYLVMGGFQQTWAKALFWVATSAAMLAVLGGIAVNHRHVVDLFRSRKGRAGMSVVLALASGLVILIALNVISYRRYKSWDVSDDARFSLSEQTMNWLKRVDEGEKTLRVVSFIPYDVKSQFTGMPPNARQMVVDLLRLYGENCRKIIVQHMQVESQRAIAIETAKALGIAGEPKETVVFKYGSKRRDVALRDMIEPGGGMFGMGRQGPPVFKGEDAITSAIRNLLDEKPKKVYFVVGHGERSPGYDPLDMSTAVEGLKGMNFDIEELSLVAKQGVPKDADCVVLAGPTRPIPAGEGGFDELDALDRYLDRGGSMLVMVDNTVLNRNSRPSGIERILRPYGVIIHQDVIAVGHEMRSSRMTGGQPVASQELSRPSSRGQALLYQACCLETEKAEKENYGVRPILEGTDGSWGERDFGRQFSYDEDEDLAGPTILGTTVVPIGDDAARRASIVVFSDVDWLTNQMLENWDVARWSVNVDLFAASVNWMVGRMENVGIPPKEQDVRTADVKPDQRSRLFWGIVVGPTALMIALGIYVWRVRSR
jgi:hypothetical protein